MLIVIFLPTILISTLFAEELLELSSIEGSNSVGNNQNMWWNFHLTIKNIRIKIHPAT